MGFSFDGTTSKSMGIASRMATENRVPELKNRTISMAGRDGVLDLGSSLSERVIGISCFIPPRRTVAELLRCKDDIVSWLSPDKGVCALMLDTEPGRVYYARLQNGVAFERVVRLAAAFDLTFFCPDPFGYAAEDEVFSITAQGSHVVNRTLGNVYSNPVYRLKGMKEFWNMIQLIFTATGGWLGWFLGGCDGLLYALVVFVVVDYITGVMCATADKKLSSEVGFKGIAKRVLIFLLVGIANILDVQVIGTGSVLRTAVIFFYLSNEGVSLLENAGHLGLPVPEKLKEILGQLHDRAENGKGDE